MLGAKPGQEIGRVKGGIGDQAVGKCQRHCGTVGPLIGLKVERAAADDVGERRIAVALEKLEGGAECIANEGRGTCRAPGRGSRGAWSAA